MILDIKERNRILERHLEDTDFIEIDPKRTYARKQGDRFLIKISPFY